MLQAIINQIVLQWGWRRAAIAFFAGVLSALAQAPYHFFPVLWLTFPVLVWLIDGAVDAGKHGRLSRLRPAALVGWWFGFGYFLAGLWWIGSAFLVEADIFGWLMPFAIVALPAGLALFWALAIALARHAWSDSPSRIFVLAVALGAAEWVRGVVLTGFPWNALGHGLAANAVQMQIVSVFGTEALSFLAVMIFAAPAILSTSDMHYRRVQVIAGILVITTYIGIVLFGLIRLSEIVDAYHENVRIRIVQPAIAQRDKWKPENRNQVFNTYLDLSERAASPDRLGMISITHLIWPESAFPFLLTENPSALAALSELLPPGTVLVTGAIRAEPAAGAAGRRTFNSIYVIDDDGIILDAYDKNHLVPFGEFLPFQGFLEELGLRQLTRIAGGFSAGSRRKPLKIPGAPATVPLICYEIIFADMRGRDGAGWILNLTNDAWFGDTPGPYQHLHQARLRAVEEGLAVIRAANTGVSAVIDPYGRLLSKLDLNVAGVIDTTLPKPIDRPLGSRHRYRPLFGVIVFLLLTIILMSQKAYVRRRK